jgi:hypothetical protein
MKKRKLKYVLDDFKMNDIIEISFWDDLRYDVMYRECKVIDVLKVYKPEILDKIVKFIVPQNVNNRKWFEIILEGK